LFIDDLPSIPTSRVLLDLGTVTASLLPRRYPMSAPGIVTDHPV